MYLERWAEQSINSGSETGKSGTPDLNIMGSRRRVFREPHICSWLRIRPPWEEKKREYRQIRYTYIGIWSMRAIAAYDLRCDATARDLTVISVSRPLPDRVSFKAEMDWICNQIRIGGSNEVPLERFRQSWTESAYWIFKLGNEVTRALSWELKRFRIRNENKEFLYSNLTRHLERRGWHVEECRLLATFLTSEWNVWY